jgi:hypothetical protein
MWWSARIDPIRKISQGKRNDRELRGEDISIRLQDIKLYDFAHKSIRGRKIMKNLKCL